jgi:hypothetical protein
METDQRYRFRWDDYRAQLIDAFETLLDGNDFVDVTLVSGETKIQAHKILLSAASPYFRYLLQGSPCQHPIIFLRDIPPDDLQILLQFIYQGEVSVCQDKLDSLLRSANSLNITALTTHVPQYERQYKAAESADGIKLRHSAKNVTKAPAFGEHEKISSKKQTTSQPEVNSIQNERHSYMSEKKLGYSHSHRSKPCHDEREEHQFEGRDMIRVGDRKVEEYCDIDDDVQEHYDENTNCEQEKHYNSQYQAQGPPANENQTSQFKLSTEMSNYVKSSYKHKKLEILLEGKSKSTSVDPSHPNWLSGYKIREYENVYFDVDKNKSAKVVKEGEKELRLVDPRHSHKVPECAREHEKGSHSFEPKRKLNTTSANLHSKESAKSFKKSITQAGSASLCDTNEEYVDDPDAVNGDEMTEKVTITMEKTALSDRKRKRDSYVNSSRDAEKSLTSHKAARTLVKSADGVQELTSSVVDAVNRDDDSEIEIVPSDNTFEVQLDCRICERTFHHQDSFMAHKKYHSGLTICSICTHPFATIGTLNRHLRSVHKIPMGKHK